MHGDLYVESYKRYKSGTKTIFKWLVTASRMCKEHIPLDTDGVDIDSDNTGADSDAPKTRSLPLSKFAQLARAVAACEEPRIEVGPRLLSVLKDVISLRKAFNVMHELNSTGSTSEDDERQHKGHRFVISVLEEIWECLQPLCVVPPARQNMTNLNNDELPGLPVGNLYSVLDVEDVEEPVFSQALVKAIEGGEQQERKPQPRSGKGGKGKKGKGKTKTKNRAVEDDFVYDAMDDGSTSLDEIYFILFCFFKDLHDIREYLRKLWASYGEGVEGASGTPLISAAVVTDLAIDVVKRKEQELGLMDITFDGKLTTVAKVLEKLKEEQSGACADLYWERPKSQASVVKGGYLGAILFDHISSARRLQDPKMKQTERDQFVSRKYVLAEWLCVPEYIMLETLQTGMLHGDGPDLGEYGNPLKPNAKAHESLAGDQSRGRFVKEHDFLGDINTELIKLSQVVPDEIPCLDVWTSALVAWQKACLDLMSPESRKKRKKRKQKLRRPILSVYMIWGSAVVLDIARVLGPNIGRGYHELKNSGYEMKHTFAKHLDWSAKWKDPGWPSTHDKTLRQLMKQFDGWVFKDHFAQLVDKVMGEIGGAQRPHWVMLHHPLWSGLFLMKYTLTFWNMGIELCNVFTTVFHPSHLYNMARAENKNTIEWKDIEYIFDLHDADWLFYGGRPSQLTAYFKKWELGMGMSISAIQGRTRRGNQSHVSSRGFEEATRLMRPRILASQMLCTRYDAMRIGYQVGDDADLQALGILLSWQSKAGQGSLVKKESQGSYIVPLLQVAASVLAADYKHYRFDYWDMHRRGWDFLTRLQEESRSDLQLADSISGDNLTARESLTIRNVPGHILSVASMIGEAHGRPTANLKRLAAIVYRSYTIIDDFSKARGSEGIDLLARRLAGEAPEPMDIDEGPDDSSDEEFDSAGLEDMLSQFGGLPGPRTTGGGARPARGPDNDRTLDRLVAGLSMDPTNTFTRDDAQLALDRLTTTPYNRLPPDTRALADLLQEGGADMGRTGVMGAMGGLANMMANLTPAQQEEVLATDDLGQLVEVLKRTGSRA